MSTFVASLIDEAALRLGDPRFTRVSRADWLQFFNEAQLDAATELRILEDDFFFTIQAGAARYTYPQNMIQMSKLSFTETPADGRSYRDLQEMFRDEHRSAATSGMYPQGSVWGYYARAAFFELVGEPSTEVIDGGLLTMWYTPTWIDVETAGDVMELPDMMRNLIRDWMLEKGLTKIGRVVEAQRMELRREMKLTGFRSKIEDRSDDRRAALRIESDVNPWGGMT